MKRKQWSPELVVQHLKRLYQQGQFLSVYFVSRKYRRLYDAARWYYGSFRKAVKSAGLNYPMIRAKINQIKGEITKQIKKFALEAKALNAAAINRDYPSLHWKARFYFGSWDKALKAAGLDPKQIRLRRKFHQWNKERVIEEIKKLYHHGKPCYVCYIQKHDGPLWGASQRYFGSYQKAVEAAGLDYGRIRKQEKRTWDAETVLSEIKILQRKGISLSVTSIKSAYCNLHYAGKRFFGSWRKAVEAAGFNYEQFLEKRWQGLRWIEKLPEEKISQMERGIEKLEFRPKRKLVTQSLGKKKRLGNQINLRSPLLPSQQRVIDEIRELRDLGKPMNAIYIQRHYKSLYGRACSYFKSWKRAVIAAGLDYLALQKGGWSPKDWLNSLSEKDLKRLEQQLISIIQGGD